MRTVLTLGSLLLAVTSAAGCSGAADAGQGRMSVVTSFYPLEFAADRMGGDCVEVTNLTPPGTEPHDLELTPDGVEAIATADVVLYVGGGFQPSIEDSVGEAQGEAIDVLRAVQTIRASAEEGSGLTVDPHVWLDPGRFALVADAIAGALEALPDACDVRGRADALEREIRDLDGSFRRGLANCELNVFVSTHAAFGYLAGAYGLRQVSIAGLAPETEPSARRLAELKTLVERDHVSTIFTEELVSPKVAQTLADEAGVDTAVLNTIEGLTEDELAQGADYHSLMKEDLDALRSALNCT